MEAISEMSDFDSHHGATDYKDEIAKILAQESYFEIKPLRLLVILALAAWGVVVAFGLLIYHAMAYYTKVQ